MEPINPNKKKLPKAPELLVGFLKLTDVSGSGFHMTRACVAGM